MKHLVLVEVESDDADETAELITTEVEAILREAGLDDPGFRVYTIDAGEVLQRWPEVVEEYMMFDLGEKGFSLDFNAVFGLMEFVYDKPVLVCQTLLRLSAALKNLRQQYYEAFNEAKEEFDKYQKEREAYFWSDAWEMSARKSAASIESLVYSDPTWQLKKRKLRKADERKSQMWNACDLVEKAYDVCEAFVKNGTNVVLERGTSDRSFSQAASAVVEFGVRVEEDFS